MTKAVFALANVLFRYFYPLYRFVYFIFKRRQDATEISLLKKFIKPGDTVLDIGANVGFYTRIISGLAGKDGYVHAFEPDPVNYRHLSDSVKNLKNVSINNAAVNNVPGELKLYTSNLLNVDHRSYPVDDFGTTFTVKAETIDQYMAGRRVNFIKMDIQGAEFFALEGMKQTLDSNSDIMMLTEFWPFALKKSGCPVEKFQQFLKDRGFLFYLIIGDVPVKQHDLSAYTDKPEEEYFNLLLTRTEI